MRVLIATAMYPKPDRPAFGSFVRTQVEALRDIGLDMHVLFLDGHPRKLVYPRGVYQLRRRIAAVRPDLVHAHHGYVGAVASTQRRVPLVVTFHGSDLLGAPDLQGELSLVRRVDARVMKTIGERADQVIVQSRQMANRLDRDDAHIVPHEIDLVTFAPTERQEARRRLGLDPDRRYVLFASPPTTAVKNFALTSEAFDLVRATDSEAELVVVHNETQPRLALYMSACDVLSVSSWQEGSPNVVKQAMACNMPIVATDVGDIREVIAGTEGCHVLRRPAPREFADALQAELRSRRRTEGRRAVSWMTREHVAQEVASVYALAAESRAGEAGGRLSPARRSRR